MEDTITLSITCPCINRKTFEHRLKKGVQQRLAPLAVQIDCPHAQENYCLKRITIELPNGVQPGPDEEILRGE
jgi:hypothetical protein